MNAPPARPRRSRATPATPALLLVAALAALPVRADEATAPPPAREAASGAHCAVAGVEAVTVFDAGCDPRHAPLPLAGPRWRLVWLDGVALPAGRGGRRPTLRFDRHGRIDGHLGCNAVRAQYRADGPRLSIDDLRLTRRTCRDEAAVSLEQRVLARLPQWTGFRIEGLTLEGLDAEGSPLMRLEAADGAPWRGTPVGVKVLTLRPASAP